MKTRLVVYICTLELSDGGSAPYIERSRLRALFLPPKVSFFQMKDGFWVTKDGEYTEHIPDAVEWIPPSQIFRITKEPLNDE